MAPVSGSPLDRHGCSPAEVKMRLEADRAGRPYLLYRHGDGHLVIHALVQSVAVGRAPGCAVLLRWDPGVSRVHAQIERVGDEWVIADERLSTNGTYVNRERLGGRRRLEHDDRILVGRTVLAFRAPARSGIA